MLAVQILRATEGLPWQRWLRAKMVSQSRKGSHEQALAELHLKIPRFSHIFVVKQAVSQDARMHAVLQTACQPCDVVICGAISAEIGIRESNRRKDPTRKMPSRGNLSSRCRTGGQADLQNRPWTRHVLFLRRRDWSARLHGRLAGAAPAAFGEKRLRREAHVPRVCGAQER